MENIEKMWGNKREQKKSSMKRKHEISVYGLAKKKTTTDDEIILIDDYKIELEESWLM